MRWRSTIDSAGNGEISALAVAETLIASVCAVWIATSVLTTWIPLAVTCAVAPLLLLRTPESTNRAIKWYARCTDAIVDSLPDNSEGWRSIPLLILFLFCLVVLSLILPLLVRIGSTIVTSLQHPLRSIQEIPRNWTRISFCTDIMHPPEVVPGIETADTESQNVPLLRVTSMLQHLLPPYKDSGEVAWGIMTLPMFYLFSIPYRYSLKATALVWLPLLWVIPHITSPTPLPLRLRLLNRSSWGRFVVFLSASTLLAMFTKLFVFNVTAMTRDWWDEHHLTQAAMDFIAPNSLPLWQIASACNSVIAIAMYFFSSYYLIVLESTNDSGSSTIADIATRATGAFRAGISLYTSSCMLYIVVSQIEGLRWPPIGDKVFPWLGAV